MGRPVKLKRNDSPLQMKMESLTSIRGLCVLLVISAHLVPYLKDAKPIVYSIGSTGVIGFFTLSSYLICRALFNNKFSYKSFIIRRIIRIYPLFVINFLIFVFILNFLKRNESNYPGFNFFNMREWFLLIANFTDISFGTSPFSHLWSVCVEMHFYLLLPLLALINKKYRNYFLIFLILFSCVINFYLVNNLISNNVWLLTTSHIGSFSMGALIANNETYLKKFAYGREVLVLLIPILVIYTTSNSFFYGRFSGINYLISSIIYSIMILIGLNNPTRKNNFLHFLGDRSYSIYLTHFTIIIIFMAKFKPGEAIGNGTATLQQTVLCFLVVILVGSLEFSIFERQILKFKSKVKFIKA